MYNIIPISYLNDFVFCPHSIYLHQVFEGGVEETYSASPQQKGRSAHVTVDIVDRKDRFLQSAYVLCEELGLYGKIDRYELATLSLIERKRTVHNLYKGFYYQVWAQYYGMTEMGFEVKKIIVESITDKRRIEIPLPNEQNKEDLKNHVFQIRSYDPFYHQFKPNVNKCRHCIYTALCDKTDIDHVYS